MIIEKAKKEQAKEIVTLLKYICEVHRKGRPDVFISGQPKYDEEAVCRLIDDENYRLVAATEDGYVIGYMIAKIVENESGPHIKTVKTLYIDDICVDKRYAHKGVGTALFEEAKRIGKGSGCERIDLNVWAFNGAAIEFYKKMGMSVSRMSMEYKLQ
ncbi:MAG: GNAT family N-acetyltransferase [Clostridia bacterium]|nr:GNAT family N-acetyltransferase [Clostridia bacterium]